MKNLSELKIYLIFHSLDSLTQIGDCPYGMPLCVDPEMKTPEGVEKVAPFPFPAHQLAEARAFYHAIKDPRPPKYVGFTPYRHNTKFSECLPVERYTPDLMARAFRDPDVKALAVRPITDFLKSSESYDDISGQMRTGFNKILFDWLRTRGFGRLDEMRIRRMAARKYVPFCNAFIMPFSEFKIFFEFFDSFIGFVYREHGLDAFPFDFNMGRKGREWAEYTERLFPLYLLTRYNRNYRLAYIDNQENFVFPNQISVLSSFQRQVTRWKETQDLKKKAS